MLTGTHERFGLLHYTVCRIPDVLTEEASLSAFILTVVVDDLERTDARKVGAGEFDLEDVGDASSSE